MFGSIIHKTTVYTFTPVNHLDVTHLNLNYLFVNAINIETWSCVKMRCIFVLFVYNKKKVQFVLFETMTVKITKTLLKQILVCSVFFGSILCFGGMFSFPCQACFLSAKMERDSKKIFQQSHGKHLVLASLYTAAYITSDPSYRQRATVYSPFFLVVVHSQKPYACQIPGCTKRYTDPSSLRKHVKAHSAKGLQDREVKVRATSIFFCMVDILSWIWLLFWSTTTETNIFKKTSLCVSKIRLD